MKKLILALIAGATALSASAQSTQPAGTGYVGVGINWADHNQIVPAGATNVDNGSWKASGKLFGGYEIDNTFGVEAGYTDFRSQSNSYTLNGTRFNQDSSGNAWYLAGKAQAPINDQFSVFGKLGWTRVKREAGPFSDKDNGVYAALGAQYNINRNVAFTAEYERYGKTSDFGPKPNTWTIAAKYMF